MAVGGLLLQCRDRRPRTGAEWTILEIRKDLETKAFPENLGVVLILVHVKTSFAAKTSGTSQARAKRKFLKLLSLEYEVDRIYIWGPLFLWEVWYVIKFWSSWGQLSKFGLNTEGVINYGQIDNNTIMPKVLA